MAEPDDLLFACEGEEDEGVSGAIGRWERLLGVPQAAPQASAPLLALQGIPEDLLGPWFKVLKECITALHHEVSSLKEDRDNLRAEVGLLRDAEEAQQVAVQAGAGLGDTVRTKATSLGLLSSSVGLSAHQALEQLNFERTASRVAVPLAEQVGDLQRLCLRGVHTARGITVRVLLSRINDASTRTSFWRWRRYTARRRQSRILHGNASARLLRRYYCAWTRRPRHGRRAAALLKLRRRTVVRTLRAPYARWKAFVVRRARRVQAARRLAFGNGRLFVMRYWRKLRGFARSGGLRGHLAWIARMSARGLARRCFGRLVRYRAERNRVQAAAAPIVLVGSGVRDRRTALAHALALTNAEVLRRRYFRSLRGFRWLHCRADVAARHGRVHHQAVLRRYHDALRRHIATSRTARMAEQLDAALTGLTSTNKVLDSVILRLVAVESRDRERDLPPPTASPVLPVHDPSDFFDPLDSSRGVSPKRGAPSLQRILENMEGGSTKLDALMRDRSDRRGGGGSSAPRPSPPIFGGSAGRSSLRGNHGII